MTRCRMRHTEVLIRMKNVGNIKGIEMPDSAIQGKIFIVEAIGPEVKDLEIGDKVLLKGVKGVDYYPIPQDSNLIVIDEKHVVLVFEEETEEQ